jgi:hypothetical protein
MDEISLLLNYKATGTFELKEHGGFLWILALVSPYLFTGPLSLVTFQSHCSIAELPVLLTLNRENLSSSFHF